MPIMRSTSTNRLLNLPRVANEVAARFPHFGNALHTSPFLHPHTANETTTFRDRAEERVKPLDVVAPQHASHVSLPESGGLLS